MLCFVFLLVISCCVFGTSIYDPYINETACCCGVCCAVSSPQLEHIGSGDGWAILGTEEIIEYESEDFDPENNGTSPFSESSDLKQDLTNIDIETPELKLSMKNCEMSGIENCKVNNTIYNLEESYFDQYYWCPNLAIRSDYDVSGLVGHVTVKGNGQSLISYYNYDIVLRCYFKKNLPFLNVQYTVTDFSFKLKPEAVILNFTGINFSNKDKDADIDENLKNLEETIREPLMRRLVTPYVQRLQLYPVFTGIFNNKTIAHDILMDIK